jgi:hypothetical protein
MLLIGMMSPPAVMAQIWLTDQGPSLLSAHEIVSIVGSEATAAVVVSQALRHVLEPTGARTVSVFASQIPAAWLPALPGVEFVRMSDADMRSHYARCGEYLYLAANKTGEKLVLTVVEGNKCQRHGQEVWFRQTPSGWVLDFSHLGGFGGGSTDCSCR